MSAIMTDTETLLNELRTIMDRREELAAEDSTLSERRRIIEGELIRFAADNGLEKFGNDKLSVSVSEDMRAKYEPDKWPAIVRWAVENGHDYIIQRRLTDAKVKDLIAEGVCLPDGLGMEAYSKISIRRK